MEPHLKVFKVLSHIACEFQLGLFWVGHDCLIKCDAVKQMANSLVCKLNMN